MTSDFDWDGFGPTLYHEFLENPPTVYLSGPCYRVHRACIEAEYFDNRSLFHFDPPKHHNRIFGSCHVSPSPEGAFLDAFPGMRVVPEPLVHQRMITELYPADWMIADLTGGLGRFDDLFSSDGHRLSQDWAAKLWDSGFRGVQYHGDSWQDHGEPSIVLWAEPGVQQGLFKSSEPEPIDEELLERVERQGHVEVIPEAPLPETPAAPPDDADAN